MANKQRKDHLIWMDLEMTGLHPASHTILQIATVITDSHLNIVDVGPVLEIYHDPEALKTMEAWSLKTHTKSGLLKRVEQSKTTRQQAEEQSLEFITRYCLPQKSPLCGNSIGHDRRFLERYMPKLFAYPNYRNIDVSTIKELVKRWYPNGVKAPQKKSKHLAIDDIHESIEELKFFREHYFIKP